MEWHKHLKLMCLMLAVLVLAWEAPGRAQPVKDVQTGIQGDAATETKKPARQRRQEAQKRFQDALEARNASIAAGDAAAPDKGGKGVKK
ncbi:hypothetical protein [Geobacter sp. SVR]|uniref:hypothetical protein n=1 Tax=Geobacter sp. SVR TaxID=2495594 RepID=UPI00143F00BD|nr:hypothetical protein [Geobacter sp. SVR]BCS53118.1 hypothetical protein GSVR_14260 [Geobacter sp. SVR]GCF84503.1 hypothetical protein GSbR_11030 [Geobacter sp. SVR]